MWMSLAPCWIADEHQRVDQADDRRLAALPLERRGVDLLGAVDDLEVSSCRVEAQILERPRLTMSALTPCRWPPAPAAASPKYCAIASRIAVSEATTGSMCRPVRNLMSSIAKTLVGSVIASVSVVPVLPTGMTLYLVAVSAGNQAHERRIEIELLEIDRRHAVLPAEHAT